jgi:hypothetical protein
MTHDVGDVEDFLERVAAGFPGFELHEVEALVLAVQHEIVKPEEHCGPALHGQGFPSGLRRASLADGGFHIGFPAPRDRRKRRSGIRARRLDHFMRARGQGDVRGQLRHDVGSNARRMAARRLDVLRLHGDSEDRIPPTRKPFPFKRYNCAPLRCLYAPARRLYEDLVN